jgi:integrase
MAASAPNRSAGPSTAKPAKPAGHVYVVERQSGRVWYAKWRDGDGQHQKRLGPAWVKPYGQTARGAARWRAADGPKPSPSHMTPDEAHDALDALLAAAPRTEQVASPHDGVTLRQAADEWLRYEEHEAQVKRSTVMDYRNCADRICRDLGDMALADITPQVIERWKAGFRAERRLASGKLRRTPPSPRTIRKYLVNLNGIFRRAHEVYGIDTNPVAEVKRPGRVKARQTLKSTDFLEPSEVHALVAAADDETDAAIFITAAFCGLRLGELLALRWGAVDFARSLVSVEASFTRGREGSPKSGDGRTVPMAPEVARAWRSRCATSLHRAGRPRLPRPRRDARRPQRPTQALSCGARASRAAPRAATRPAPHVRHDHGEPGRPPHAPAVDGPREHRGHRDVHGVPRPSRGRRAGVGRVSSDQVSPFS